MQLKKLIENQINTTILGNMFGASKGNRVKLDRTKKL